MIFLITNFSLIKVLYFLAIFFILPTFEEKIYEGKHQTTRYAVEIALGTINKFYQDFKDKKITEEVAKTEKSYTQKKQNNTLMEIYMYQMI